MPVLAIGGEKSFGANEAVVMRNAATNVTEVVIPNAGHWLMEEEPALARSVPFWTPRTERDRGDLQVTAYSLRFAPAFSRRRAAQAARYVSIETSVPSV